MASIIYSARPAGASLLPDNDTVAEVERASLELAVGGLEKYIISAEFEKSLKVVCVLIKFEQHACEYLDESEVLNLRLFPSRKYDRVKDFESIVAAMLNSLFSADRVV